MRDTTTSVNRINIRLTDERWAHIVEEHGELNGLRAEVLQTVKQPERVLAGNEGEFLAVREMAQGKYIIVVYRELKDDGFVITAFLTRRVRTLAKRKQIWP